MGVIGSVVPADRPLSGVNAEQAEGNCGQGIKLAGEQTRHPTCGRYEGWISGEVPELMGRGAFGGLEHPGKEINPFWEDAQRPHHLQVKTWSSSCFSYQLTAHPQTQLAVHCPGLHTGKIQVIMLMASAKEVETCQQGGLSSIKVLLFSFPPTSKESRICLSIHQVCEGVRTRAERIMAVTCTAAGKTPSVLYREYNLKRISIYFLIIHLSMYHQWCFEINKFPASRDYNSLHLSPPTFSFDHCLFHNKHLYWK